MPASRRPTPGWMLRSLHPEIQMRITVALIVVTAASLLGWLLWQQSRAAPFMVSGFIEADEIRVGSQVGGRVSRVEVQEGSRVRPGDLLFELEPFDLREQLSGAQARLAAAAAEHARLMAGYRREEIEQARAKRDSAKATLEKLIAGPRPQEIAIAREELNRAQANLDLAEAEAARLEILREGQRAAPKEYDEAVRTLKASRAEAAAAEQRLKLLEEGTRQEEIAEARAMLAQSDEALALLEAGFRKEEIAQAEANEAAARAEAAAIERRLAELSVESPCDCMVEAIELQPGDLIAPNAPGAALLDLSRLWVRAYVPEGRLGHLSLGRKVPIRVDSFPNERFTGRITFISTDAEFTPKNVQTPEERSKQVFRIKVTIEQGRERLRVGMGADVFLDQEPDA